MKRFFSVAFILALVSIPSFAASKSATIRLASETAVGSTKLPAGEYKLTWDGTAPNVQVTLVQKDAMHPATANVPAKLTEQKHDRIAITTAGAAAGTSLQNVQLKDVTLDFSSGPSTGQ